MNDHLKRIGGWSAILSGAVAFVGDIFLILFYALEASLLLEARTMSGPAYFGRLNDAAAAIQVLLMILIVLAFLRVMQIRAPVSVWQKGLAVAVIISMLIISCIQFLYTLKMIGVDTQTKFVLPAWAIVGLWMILTHHRARTQRLLPASLAWLGIAVGAAYILMFISFYAFGGQAATATGDPSTLVSNYPFMISFVVSMLIGFFAYPIWAIWLGRVLLSGKLIEQSTVRV